MLGLGPSPFPRPAMATQSIPPARLPGTRRMRSAPEAAWAALSSVPLQLPALQGQSLSPRLAGLGARALLGGKSHSQSSLTVPSLLGLPSLLTAPPPSPPTLVPDPPRMRPRSRHAPSPLQRLPNPALPCQPKPRAAGQACGPHAGIPGWVYPGATGERRGSGLRSKSEPLSGGGLGPSTL